MLSLRVLARISKCLILRSSDIGKIENWPYIHRPDVYKSFIRHSSIGRQQCQLGGKLHPSLESVDSHHVVTSWGLRYNVVLQSLKYFLYPFSNAFLTIQVSLTGIVVVSGRLVSNPRVCLWHLLGFLTTEDSAHHSSLLQGCAFPSWAAIASSHFMLQQLL